MCLGPNFGSTQLATQMFYSNFTGLRRLNSTQLYEWLIDRGIDEVDAQKLQGIMLYRFNEALILA